MSRLSDLPRSSLSSLSLLLSSSRYVPSPRPSSAMPLTQFGNKSRPKTQQLIPRMRPVARWPVAWRDVSLPGTVTVSNTSKRCATRAFHLFDSDTVTASLSQPRAALENIPCFSTENAQNMEYGESTKYLYIFFVVPIRLCTKYHRKQVQNFP